MVRKWWHYCLNETAWRQQVPAKPGFYQESILQRSLLTWVTAIHYLTKEEKETADVQLPGESVHEHWPRKPQCLPSGLAAMTGLAAKIPRLDKWLHMSRQRYGYTELLEDTVVRFIFVVFITVQITLADLEKINFQSFLPSMSPFLINFGWSGLKTNVAAKGPVPGALLWASVLQRLAKPQGSSARPRQPQAARNLCTRGVQTQLQMSSGPSTNTQKGQGTVARKEPMERSWQQLLCSKRRRAEWHFSMSCRDLRWDPILKG